PGWSNRCRQLRFPPYARRWSTTDVKRVSGGAGTSISNPLPPAHSPARVAGHGAWSNPHRATMRSDPLTRSRKTGRQVTIRLTSSDQADRRETGPVGARHPGRHGRTAHDPGAVRRSLGRSRRTPCPRWRQRHPPCRAPARSPAAVAATRGRRTERGVRGATRRGRRPPARGRTPRRRGDRRTLLTPPPTVSVTRPTPLSRRAP